MKPIIPKQSNIDQLAKNLLKGDKLALSKALTLVESKRREDAVAARELIQRIIPHTGKSLRLGITGAPGVGKSTFIEKFGAAVLLKYKNLAVLSIDPSSPSSGGSILGDKTRMEELSRDERVFVRPTPSGIDGGGVSTNTRDQIALCEAAGFEVVIVETVGVGQGETAVSHMVDYLLLMLMPGSGDDLQGIKRGIMEVAHAFAFTKKDEQKPSLMNKSISDLRLALHLLHEQVPEIFSCSGLSGEGIDDIWNAVLQFKENRIHSGEWEREREIQDLNYFEVLLKRNVLLEFMAENNIETMIEDLKRKISAKEMSPVSAVELIIAKLFTQS